MINSWNKLRPKASIFHAKIKQMFVLESLQCSFIPVLHIGRASLNKEAIPCHIILVSYVKQELLRLVLYGVVDLFL